MLKTNLFSYELIKTEMFEQRLITNYNEQM